MLTNYLEEYKRKLIAKDKKIECILTEGLQDDKISQILVQNGYIASHEIIDLYKWGNGANLMCGQILNDVYLIPGFYFLSLPKAIEMALEYRKPHPFPMPRWEVDWLPILSDDMRSNYLVDLSNNETSKVIEFFAEESEWKVFESIEMFFRFQLECIEQRVYFENRDKNWVSDYTKYTVLKNKWTSSEKITNQIT